MKTLLNSPLKAAANNIVKIGYTPKARRVRSLDFDRRSEYKTFVDWIKGSSDELTEVKLPSKRELIKLTKFDVEGGGGTGVGGLLGLLGAGAGLLGGLIPTLKIPRLPRLPRSPKKLGDSKKKKPKSTTRPSNRQRPGKTRVPRLRPSIRRTDSKGNQIARRGAQYRNQISRIVKPGQMPKGLTMGPKPGSLKSIFASSKANMQTGTLFGGRGAALQRTLYNAPGRTKKAIESTKQVIKKVTQPVTNVASKVGSGVRKVISPLKPIIKGVSRIPVVGSLLAGIFTYYEDADGDGKPDKKLDKSLFVAGGTAIGGLLGSFIPIPVLGTLMGTLIGEYTGGLFYELLRGGGADAAGKKLKEDLQKLLSVGKAVTDWAGRGFGRLYEGFPKIKVFGLGEVINPFTMHEGILNLPKAFFSNEPMNETKEEKELRLEKEKKEEEERTISQNNLVAQTERQSGMSSFREDSAENRSLQEDPLKGGLGLDIEGRPIKLNPSTAEAWKETVAAAAADGVDLASQVTSSLRTAAEQQALIDRAAAGDPNVMTPAAVGSSPHQQGWAVDINYNSEANAWMRKNGSKFGWRWQGQSDPVHFDFMNNEANDKWLKAGNDSWLKGVNDTVISAGNSQGPRLSESISTDGAYPDIAVLVPQQSQQQSTPPRVIPVEVSAPSGGSGASGGGGSIDPSTALNMLWQTTLLTKLSA